MGNNLQFFLEDAIFQYGNRTAYQFQKKRYRYKDIDLLSNQLANALNSHDIFLGDRIGVLTNNPIHNIITYLAALKIGAVCVPLNPGQDQMIVNDIKKDSKIKSFIVDEKMYEFYQPSTFQEQSVFSLESLQDSSSVCDLKDIQCFSTDYISLDIEDNNESFIFFTSGSTGVKKGVVLQRKSLLEFIKWGGDFLEVKPNDKFLCHAPLYFDMSLFSLFIPFFSGGMCVLTSNDQRNNPRYLNQLIKEEQVNILHLVPSSLKLLLNEKNQDYKSVRFLGLAGEALPSGDIQEVRGAFKYTDIVNFYGSTEVNEALAFSLPKDVEGMESLPIGKPLKHVEVRVLNQDLFPCKDGEVGELYVNSSTMLKCYVNKSIDTTFKFLDDNLKVKYFPTGDLVKFENDLFHYMGRKDDMVKIQGKRVYLSEVRDIVSNHKAINEVFVCMYEGSLISIVSSNTAINSLEMRVYCSIYLEPHAIPSKFIFMEDHLPKTSTGKIDRKLLQECLGG
ncbi:AMP-binding protein [Bacillus thuringiensis]|uniref:AMP-binding protein n=1 Tax=Bacillus thuringiensis TaxID=1428 RepID=UPI0015CEFE8C|nr:AMP-binding protein [Bacillus thuringiensis]